MNKRIKSILRCYASGMGIKEMACTFCISRNTVRKYVRHFLSSGKSIEELLPKGLNWKRCFPIMYLNYHVKG